VLQQVADSGDDSPRSRQDMYGCRVTANCHSNSRTTISAMGRRRTIKCFDLFLPWIQPRGSQSHSSAIALGSTSTKKVEADAQPPRAVCWCIESLSIPVNAIDVTVIGGGLAGMLRRFICRRPGCGFCASNLTRRIPGQEDVKKLKNWCGEMSALKKVAPGCPVSDRWGVGIHFASA